MYIHKVFSFDFHTGLSVGKSWISPPSSPWLSSDNLWAHDPVLVNFCSIEAVPWPAQMFLLHIFYCPLGIQKRLDVPALTIFFPIFPVLTRNCWYGQMRTVTVIPRPQCWEHCWRLALTSTLSCKKLTQTCSHDQERALCLLIICHTVFKDLINAFHTSFSKKNRIVDLYSLLLRHNYSCLFGTSINFKH